MLRLLIVEDNPADVRLVRELLKDAEEEVSVHSAATIGQALELLAGEDIHVVLLDLGLPDNVGLTGLRRIVSERPATPVVVMTGHRDRQLATEALHAGAQDYLPKGRVDGELVARSLRYAVERKKLEVARETLVKELTEALAQVKTLSGLVPICSYCKRIRDDEGYWTRVESYVAERSQATFSHSICPACKAALEQQDIDRGAART